MRYAPDHSERTKQKILEVASRRFRKEGTAAVGIASIMADVGLTHGGFYAHFDNKDALIAQAIAFAAHETLPRFKPNSRGPVAKALDGVVADYLSESHRSRPAHGCVLAALASSGCDVGAAGGTELAEALKQRFAALAELLPKEARGEDREVAIFALLLGGMVMSRVFDDKKQAARILSATSRAVREIAKTGSVSGTKV